jgi:hypothetical protein
MLEAWHDSSSRIMSAHPVKYMTHLKGPPATACAAKTAINSPAKSRNPLRSIILASEQSGLTGLP